MFPLAHAYGPARADGYVDCVPWCTPVLGVRARSSTTGRAKHDAGHTAYGQDTLTPWLPFEQTPVPWSTRKVFAHYVPTMPVAFQNPDNYWVPQYLNQDGENGKHKAYGGFVRDTPEPLAAGSADWAAENAVTEIRTAQRFGVDGFTLNVMDIPPATSVAVTYSKALVTAAERSGFLIMPMLDVTLGWANQPTSGIVDYLVTLNASPAVHRVNGSMVLSAFGAEAKPRGWWVALLDALKARNVPVRFVPTFLNADTGRALLGDLSVGWGDWGDRNPTWNLTPERRRRITDAHAAGKQWFQPVSVQQQIPHSGLFDEAENLTNLRTTWGTAIDGGADLVQLVTWNDHAEHTHARPSVHHGDRLLTVSAYYAQWWRTGAPPAIVRDLAVVTHRTQLAAALPSPPPLKPMLLAGGSPARDTAEVMVFLTQPATVELRSGGNLRTYQAPAGVTPYTCALDLGYVTAKVTRGGVLVAENRSPWEVKTPTTVQDLQYVAA